MSHESNAPRKPLKTHRDLIAWQLAVQLEDAVYELCTQLQKHPRLREQLEDAAGSVPANIAEGYGRASRKEYVNFLSISIGSLREVETRALAARKRVRDRAVADRVMALADRTGALLFSLRRSLLPEKTQD